MMFILFLYPLRPFLIAYKMHTFEENIIFIGIKSELLCESVFYFKNNQILFRYINLFNLRRNS